MMTTYRIFYYATQELEEKQVFPCLLSVVHLADLLFLIEMHSRHYLSEVSSRRKKYSFETRPVLAPTKLLYASLMHWIDVLK